ncbi:hypothetical protein SUS17_984 [Sphingomonas sp. S17]|nr:hypothetical protein SUS17_984 [Sphingomonas sp. S17]
MGASLSHSETELGEGSYGKTQPGASLGRRAPTLTSCTRLTCDLFLLCTGRPTPPLPRLFGHAFSRWDLPAARSWWPWRSC